MHSLSDHFTYAFSHTSMRDALVFKSIVGLLSGRTSAHWEHINTGAPDLLIVGNDVSSTDSVLAQLHCSQILRLSSDAGSSQGLSIHLPLKPQDVFERLEAVSRLLREPAHNIMPHVSYRLSSWPPERCFKGRSDLMRAAAMLNARALTVEQLQERSAIGYVECLAFIQALEVAGVLHVQHGDVAIVEPVPERKGFFARLRAHLGLANKDAAR